MAASGTILRAWTALCLFWIAGGAQAQEAFTDGESRSALAVLESGVQSAVLDNGLTVLMYRRGIAPVFAGVVTVRVGGVDEPEGLTGAAHLLEHMAFKGTSEIGTKHAARERVLWQEYEVLMRAQIADERPDAARRARLEEIGRELEGLWDSGELERAYSRRGATGMNATTSVELTNYFLNLPRPSFEFWCWMESERLRDPAWREFYKERDVVLEERRMRFEDDPQGKLYESLLGAAYTLHPYRHPVIGYERDLKRLSATAAREFQREFYVPANMVVTVVGDVEFARDIKIVDRWFGRLPKGPASRRTSVREPQQQGERALELKQHAAPSLAVAYHKPVYPDPDDAPLSVMAEILAGGKLSPLYVELVKKERVAAAVESYEAPGAAYPNLLVFDLQTKRPHRNREVLERFDRVLADFKRRPPSAEDLLMAKRDIAMSYLGRLRTNLNLARDLGGAQAIYGDWRVLLRWYEEMTRVRPADVLRVARRYLVREHRSVARLEQTETGGGERQP